ncbi:MAG TPA: hypothetical protein VMX16_06885 [Terriglobia bacterium]|nr:hypothetical protein [Terriglobia bacterium]
MALSVAILRETVAQSLGESLRPAWIEAGLRLDPNQPALHHRLGMIRFYSTDHPDATGGLRLLRHAVKMQPKSAPYWRDLASACAATGDTACADRAFQRAVALNPMSPGLHWVIANYDLEMNRTEAGFAEFKRLLNLDPGYSGSVFHMCLQMDIDDGVVWNKIVDGNRHFRVPVEWIKTLAGEGRLDDAYRAWREEMRSLAEPQVVTRQISYADVRPFLDSLIQPHWGRKAEAVWSDLGRIGLVHAGRTASRQANLIFNGDFEHNPLNSGFDWQLTPASSIMISREVGGPHGTSTLRIDFTPPANAAFEPVYEYVPVEPDQTYELSAQVKSQSITSDRGPQLRVADAFGDTRQLASTPGMTGTSTWQQVRVTFRTGPETRFVKISVWRARSRAFPFDISGAFWLTSVCLQPVHSMQAASEMR